MKDTTRCRERHASGGGAAGPRSRRRFQAVIVTVKLFADLRCLLPKSAADGAAAIEAGGGATVREVLAGLGVDLEKELVILVNSARAEKDAPLKENDVLAVFPPIEGG